MSKDIRVNEQIRAKEVRLIDVDGKQLSVVPIGDALRIAGERGLDLIEVASNVIPPVCKILDFGKYRYQISKRQTQRKTIDIKEVKIRPQITEHDLGLKVKNIRRFLDDGNKAKVTMFFKGREIVRRELGMKVFGRITQLLTGKFNLEQAPRLEGNRITMVIAPK
ncbi:MAG: translation initiation factor IF-3 [Nitrospirae bacterium CG_4_10_14_0_8_um_filter_41_23]|nr:translation initiation factor IF-3 [Nitrospirota bacterium]PIQ94510.1 MAG: translation initiation factor IF-3 [Nitrospirae bacterium CG11_big_fil_rev_8_21_14_0_20_41_14]PIV42901.1 MAG: translation initiation factor IF-3 [Nitrospirae bacterium CG02_land_8_20_14_3_00_41_53]PIW87782.1 MAG: translation initiation factor IF-3 [Nitrospirae bacterium CG_4_8_14_3_um_filter_41_47]PIY86893.1 MAG: translation initiation factor IF-3 [Nitrospirae bacterium CG_4_10_14_0_8_um_filter_41_23]PJA79606.1 MAG: 